MSHTNNNNNPFFGGGYSPGRAPSILELMFTSPLTGPAGNSGGYYPTASAGQYRPRSTPYHHNFFPSYYNGPEPSAYIVFNDAREVEEAAARQHRRIEEQKSHHHRELQSRQMSAQQNNNNAAQQQQQTAGASQAQGQDKTSPSITSTTVNGSPYQQRARAARAAHAAASQQHQAPSWLTPYGPPFFGGNNDDLPTLLSTGLGPLTLSPTSSIPYLSHSHLSSFSPRIDVHEDNKAFTLTAELPGMPREAVKVNVDDEKRMVLVEGEMRREYGSGKAAAAAAADEDKDKGSDSAAATTEKDSAAANNKDNSKQPPSPRHHVTERLYGHFSRSLYLPESAELDHVSASFKDGLLRVVVPKKQKKEGGEKGEVEEVKKRKVTVEEVME